MHKPGRRELTDSRNRRNDLTELELVQDGGLTSGIETDHQNSHLFLGEKPAEQLREREPHSDCGSLHIHNQNQTVRTTKPSISTDRADLKKNDAKAMQKCHQSTTSSKSNTR